MTHQGAPPAQEKVRQVMTKRERVEAVYRLERADRVPFVPAIYEHKGFLIGRSPSEICRNADYLHAAIEREIELYDADMVVIGIDVYNVEAEALGCKVIYFEDSTDVPAITSPIIEDSAGIHRLRFPDPERNGRMPVYLEVARDIARRYSSRMIVRGAVTGPYSMAAALAGAERLAMATSEDLFFARELLQFCAQMTVLFGKAFLGCGVEPIIFDSHATPRLASPRVFMDLVLPLYRDQIYPELKASGGRFIPLIIGGDTTAVVESLAATGASQLLCDCAAKLSQFRTKWAQARIPFRANVDARLVSTGSADAVKAQALEILQECGDYPGLLLGCGVVAYGTDPANVLAIRKAIDAFYTG